MNKYTSHLLFSLSGIVVGAAITGATVCGINDALHRQVKDLGERVTDERIARVEMAAELLAIRDIGACDGIPIDEEYAVGRVIVMRGSGIVALREAE